MQWEQGIRSRLLDLPICGKPETSYLFQPQPERRHWNDALGSINVHEGQPNLVCGRCSVFRCLHPLSSLDAFRHEIKRFIELD